MIAVARYLLAEYLSSRRFVAPLAFLLAGVVVLYAQPPNPVLSTAGTVAAFASAASCWGALALLNTQGDADRHILVAVLGPRGVAVGRMAALLTLAMTFTGVSVAFPILTGRFARPATVAEVALCLTGTLACSLAPRRSCRGPQA